MTKKKKQLRGKDGRFMKEPTWSEILKPNSEDKRHENNWFTLVLSLAMVALLCMVYFLGVNDGNLKGHAEGYVIGYSAGHDNGMTETQQAIWNDGFTKGRAFDQNWTIKDYWWLRYDEKMICEKKHSTSCAITDLKMNFKYWLPTSVAFV